MTSPRWSATTPRRCAPFDDEIAARAPWTVVRVRAPAARTACRSGGERPGQGWSTVSALRVPVAAGGVAPMAGRSRRCARAASEVPADLYIAHYVAGLPAAGCRRATARRDAGLRCRGLPLPARDGQPAEASRMSDGAHRRGRVAAALPACHRRRAADRRGLCRALRRRADDGAQCLSARRWRRRSRTRRRQPEHLQGLLVLADHRPRPRPAVLHPGDGAHQDARHPRHPRRQPVGPRRAADGAGARARHRRPRHICCRWRRPRRW